MSQIQVNRKMSKPNRRRKRRILLPAFYCDPNTPLIPFAKALSEEHIIQVLGLVSVEAKQSLSKATDQTQELRTRLRRVVRDVGGRLWPKIIASHHPLHEITAFVTEQNVTLMVLPWLREPAACRSLIKPLIELAPCPIAIAHGNVPVSNGSILIVLRGSPDSILALRLGLTLTRSGDFTLTTLRLSPVTEKETQRYAQSGIEQVLEHLPQVQDALLLADDPLQAVLEQAEKHDLVILGACEPMDDNGQNFDEFVQHVIDRAPCPVLIACAQSHPSFQPTVELAGMEAISVLVDKWFAENTFRASEFENFQYLLRRKQEQGVTISLALPALNEEETVGNVISTVKRTLMKEIPLLDEIVLIDSNSTDRTREIANSLGVPVYIHQEILPQYGARQGKGEALWKSLYVTSGDIILWIDTDIVNIHPRFVYGLIGPLLHRPNLMFIKGFYLRPMRVGRTIQAGGGGRVTELTARPLLNLFYPPLSGFIQPLSGEYGGRREALEQLPFSSGYGVEIGLLIDVLDRFGLSALGQVDLIKRIHHNQPLAALSKMSFSIIQTVIRKLDRRYRLQLLDDVNLAMKLIRRQQRRFFLEVEEIAERERQPMLNLPEYQARFKEAS